MTVARRTMRGGAEPCALFADWFPTGVSVTLFFITSLLPSVLSADDLPRFTREPESAIVAHHQPVTLRCSVHPSSAEVGWLYQGQPLDLSDHPGLQRLGNDLHFRRFSHGSDGSHGNDGEYRCTASTSAGTAVSTAAVLSKPELHSFPTNDDINIVAYEGGYVTLPCSAPYSLPPATVRVQNSRGQLLQDSPDNVQRLPSGSVVLRNLRIDQSDNYTCVAFNPVNAHNRSASHRIRLSVKPRSLGMGDQSTQIVDRSTPTLQVIRGQSVLMECPVAGLGTPSIVWTRGYGSLPSARSQQHFGNMRITSARLRDSGTYICETPTGQKRQVVLEVQTGPWISRHPADGLVQADLGDSVRLVCKGGAFPAPSLVWFHNDKVHSHPSLHSAGEDHVLSLHAVRKEQEGLYTCHLSNTVGQASTVLRLTIRDRGRDDRRWDTQRDNPADDIMGDRAVDDVIGGGDEVASNNRNFRLEVSNNNRKDRKKNRNGKKRNGRKRDKKKWKAKKVKLVPPSAPTVSRLSETSVMVLWTVPDNDGLPISLFRVQYKEVKPNKGQWQTVEDDINPKARRYKVGRLKAGGTYKFRMAAVYSNNDNRNSRNSLRFHLNANPSGEMRPPKDTPRIVEAKPIIYQNIYAIGIKWQYLPARSSSITGFYIYYKPYGAKEKFKMERLLGPNIRNHLLIDLQADTEYSVKMQCFNKAGASEFSNVVVKRTLPVEGQSTPHLLPPVLPPQETGTKASTTKGPAAGGLDQPVILGVVLGVMLLLLVVFIVMCWWKQRQQKRHSRQTEDKYHDHLHNMYSESMGKPKRNGGGPYAMNGMKNPSLPNGHCPPAPYDQQLMGPHDLSPHDRLDGGHQFSQAPSQRDLYSGKPYHHGNGMVMGGTMPGYGHTNGSDNNFNNIGHTASSDNMLAPPGVAMSNGMGSLPHSVSSRTAGNYSSHLYPPPASLPPHSRTSSFSHSSLQRQRAGSLSLSDHVDDSGDEREPLRKDRAPHSQDGLVTSSPYRGLAAKGRERDGDREAGCGQGDHRPGYGYNASYEALPLRADSAGYHWRRPTAPSPSLSSSHTGKQHKRRRKRAHTEREHTTKDQATNTDLSSNEGTVDWSMLNKSPAGSLSNGSESSGPSDRAHLKQHCVSDPQCPGPALPCPTPLTLSAGASL